MPIRFDSGGDDNNNFGNKGTGGSSKGNNTGAIAVLMFVLFFVFRKPKIAIPILLIGGILFYFFGGADSFLNKTSNGIFGTGCGLDEEKYDKTMVYEPLASNSSKNNIPSAASLLRYAPKRRNQGQQGSCVGWATAYAARSIVEAVSTGKNPDEVSFSPAFLYNQIALPGCQGSYTSEALEKMKKDGLVYYDKFLYDENTCSKIPSSDLLAEAKNFKIRGYNRLSKGGSNYDVDIDALKQNIAQGAPVVIAMNVPESFFYVNTDLWSPKSHEYKSVERLGGHAMCVIGYDDNKFGGAIQIMNSWGRNWGNDGVFWIKYKDFSKFTREAYGLFPHAKLKEKEGNEFDVAFGLVDADKNVNIPVKQVKGNLFKTISPIGKGDRFKIEVSNNVECYIYVFGQETNGSSYILFPYIEEGKTKSKFSPFCGIVGTRQFPSGKAALKADDIGNQDFMAVVVSKDELDYQELNNRINRSPGGDYLSKLNKAMGSMQIVNPNFKLNASSVSFKGNTNNAQKAVGVVLAIDKN